MLLKPFEERTGAGEDVTRSSPRCARNRPAIREANVIPFNVPPIIGLGTSGGFEFQLLDLQGGKPGDLAAVARGLIFAANQDSQLASVFTTYSADAAALPRHRP